MAWFGPAVRETGPRAESFIEEVGPRPGHRQLVEPFSAFRRAIHQFSSMSLPQGVMS